MPRKKNDDGPSTHSEKLKVEYDQVMYAIHRSAKRFCAPGIHSGVPELAVLLDRNFNTLESQLNPTNFDHAPRCTASSRSSRRCSRVRQWKKSRASRVTARCPRRRKRVRSAPLTIWLRP